MSLVDNIVEEREVQSVESEILLSRSELLYNGIIDGIKVKVYSVCKEAYIKLVEGSRNKTVCGDIIAYDTLCIVDKQLDVAEKKSLAMNLTCGCSGSLVEIHNIKKMAFDDDGYQSRLAESRSYVGVMVDDLLEVGISYAECIKKIGSKVGNVQFKGVVRLDFIEKNKRYMHEVDGEYIVFEPYEKDIVVVKGCYNSKEYNVVSKINKMFKNKSILIDWTGGNRC